MRLYFVHSHWMDFLVIMSTILTLDDLNVIKRKHFPSLFLQNNHSEKILSIIIALRCYIY